MSEKDILKRIDAKPNFAEKKPSNVDDIDELLNLFLPLCTSIIHKLQTESFLTLWEIWKYVSSTLNITFPIEVSFIISCNFSDFFLLLNLLFYFLL